MRYLLFLFLIFSHLDAFSTEAILKGKIDSLHYRAGYIMFKVTSGGINNCNQCAADPGKMASGGYCWINKDDTLLQSITLTAYAAGKDISARVSTWDSCNIYEFHSY